jgi:hypothetical protein
MLIVKTNVALLIALALLTVGCDHDTVPRRDMTPEMLRAFGKEQYDLLQYGVANATNKDDIIPVIAGEIHRQLVEQLAEWPPSQLERLLGAVQTGSEKEFTRHEVIDAMRRHNDRPRTKKIAIPKE